MNELARMIERSARYWPDKTAVIESHNRLTFAQVHEMSSRLASSLAARGLRRGDRVGVLLHNSCECVVTDFALMKAGLVRVPLNTRLAFAEHEYILRDSGAAALIYSGDLAGQVSGLEAIPGLATLISLGEGLPGSEDWALLVQEGDPHFQAVDVTPDDLHQILYTSGTTGRPKGAVTNYRSRVAAIQNVFIDETPVGPNDVMLHVASLAHGTGTKVMPHFIKGATNVLLKKYTPRQFCEAVQQHRVTTTWLVPTIIGDLLQFPELDQYDLSSLKTIVYAAAPMPVERLREAIAKFGPIFVQVYGLSEAPNPDLVLRREDHVVDGTPDQVRRLASAGREVTFLAVRVVDEQGRDVPTGEVGEIIIKGDNIMCGYWNLPDATAETIKDGWLYTGDMATVDDQGYVFIVDRKKDLIISGGFNVYPREVEETLFQHPAVLEAAVFGVPDSQWGEAVRAAVVLRPGVTVTEEELIDFCRGRMAGYKKPRNIDFVDFLPKNANGKIDKKALRLPFWSGQTRMVN